MTRVFSPTRHGIPLLAIAMVSFAGWSIAAKHEPRVAASPPIAAPTNPYVDNVAGTGVVEPASEVIALAIERGGVVARIDVMAGDRVKAGQPLFAIDDRDYRAAVDQGDAALARLRGNPEISAPLTFVRFEPYVLAKRSLTGDTTERVDTRVLQAIYQFSPSAFPVFVGQQVDVFIAAPSRAAATRSPTSGQTAFSPVSDSRRSE
jgi:hypothetical protein